MPIIFKSILLLIFFSWSLIGLDSPAKWIKILGLIFFKYLSIFFSSRIFNSFFLGNNNCFLKNFFFKIFPNLPEPPYAPEEIASLYTLSIFSLVINGDMQVAQRGTSLTGQTGSGFQMDRFGFQII